MRSLILSLSLLVCMPGCAVHRGELITGDRYRLFFPPLLIATVNGERVESVEVAMSCGRFRALAVIPDDWSVEVVSPMSERTKLRAGCGHGSSALWSLRDLDGAITITIEDASCFDISATVVTSVLEHDRRHQFTRSDLILKP